jgi:glycosyltransferase involved in cell wall biosynthesis
MNRKILIHSLIFSPDCVSTAYLYNDIALKLKECGFEVSILTTTPHYNMVESELIKQPLKKKLCGLYYQSNFHGICVKHIPQKKIKNTLLRIFGFVHWHFLSFFIGLFEENIDIILSPSPPLTIGVINILLGKLKHAKVVYNVQEIYPDLLIENYNLKSNLIISLLKSIEKFVYNKSDCVITIDEIFYNTLVDRFEDKSKLKVIPNFVNTELYHPILQNNNLDKNLFSNTDTNSLKLMYAGNIGFAQDWDTLIEVALKLKNCNIEFIIIGEGIQKKYLQKEKEKLHLKKLHILPYQSRELMPYLIAYSDIQFIFMSKNTEKNGFPSKIYTIMACAKPLLVCSGKQTPVINFLINKKCAFLITESKKKEKISAIIDILTSVDKSKLLEMGKEGLDIIQKNYTKEIVTEQYYKTLNSIQ